MKIIVGLGNPGKEYEYTRHNLGFLVVTLLAQQNSLKFLKSSVTQALTAQGEIGNQEVVLLLPWTYVNNSGSVVNQIMVHQAISPENILVVCDDLNTDFGQIRLRSQGSGGGHNGLASIIEKLKTKKFPRLRMGIGSPLKKEETVNFVLGEFSSNEKKALGDFIQKAADCCLFWLAEGIYQAMDQYNKRKRDE